MAYASTYERVLGAGGFTDHSTNFPTTPQSGANLDAEFNTIRSRMNEMLVNSTLIQRSDGALKNGIVTQDSLAPNIYAGINSPSPWVTATTYSLRDSVTINGILYRCIVAHTSGVFATDLTAAKWTLVIDFAELIGDIALSDDTPTTIAEGAGTAGTSDFASRSDHEHPYTAPVASTNELSYGGQKAAAFTFQRGHSYICVLTGSAFTVCVDASFTASNRVELVKVGTNALTLELNGNQFYGSSTNPVTTDEGTTLLVHSGTGQGIVEMV